MKILYVDLEYDYGMKHRGPNQIGGRGFRDCFLRLGHEVDFFYYDDYLQRLPELQDALLKKVDSSRPDLVYFILFGEQFSVETIAKVKAKTKTMNWFGDDQWRFDSFTTKYAPVMTYNVTTDPFAVSKYRSMGWNVVLSQWAAIDDERPLDKIAQYKHDVSFVGGSHSVRRWFVHELEKKGIQVATFGYGWPNGPISLDAMIDLFQQTKINLNLSNSTTLDLRYLLDSYKNPIVAWRSPKSASQIKARNFEIPYYGGFQMTDYVPTLERYLEIGKEVICYRDVDEAILLIDYYLKNESERESIRQASHQRARREHSYFSRHQAVFRELGL